jgi:hypothetical protein
MSERRREIQRALSKHRNLWFPCFESALWISRTAANLKDTRTANLPSSNRISDRFAVSPPIRPFTKVSENGMIPLRTTLLTGANGIYSKSELEYFKENALTMMSNPVLCASSAQKSCVKRLPQHRLHSHRNMARDKSEMASVCVCCVGRIHPTASIASNTDAGIDRDPPYWGAGIHANYVRSRSRDMESAANPSKQLTLDTKLSH